MGSNWTILHRQPELNNIPATLTARLLGIGMEDDWLTNEPRPNSKVRVYRVTGLGVISGYDVPVEEGSRFPYGYDVET